MNVTRPTPAHFGIFVFDIDKMAEFYLTVFKLTVTDQGLGPNFGNMLVFMSAAPDQHHQFVLSAGRKSEHSTVMQASFMVPGMADLRRIRADAERLGAANFRPMNHGNAWSLYFHDPEGNMVEVYLDSPYHVSQPYGSPLDLNKSDEELVRETFEMVRNDPTFMPMEQWRARFDQRQRGQR